MTDKASHQRHDKLDQQEEVEKEKNQGDSNREKEVRVQAYEGAADQDKRV